MEPFRHVAVATDFSECGEAAVEAAVDVAARYGAALTLIHVVEIPAYAYAGMDTMPINLTTPVSEAAREAMQHALTRAQKRIPAAQAKLEPTGVSWQRIIAVAQQVGADLLVVGTHGRTGLQHALIGSVAERVVRHSPIPVLSVSTPKKAG